MISMIFIIHDDQEAITHDDVFTALCWKSVKRQEPQVVLQKIHCSSQICVSTSENAGSLWLTTFSGNL